MPRFSGSDTENNLLVRQAAGHDGVPSFSRNSFTRVGQSGTRVDPPAHFIKGLRTVDQIDPKEMILPLVVINVHEKDHS
jgi:kynurenine formamidase